MFLISVAVCLDVCGHSTLLHKQSVHTKLTHAICAVCLLVKTGVNLKGPKVVGKSRCIPGSVYASRPNFTASLTVSSPGLRISKHATIRLHDKT